MFRQALLLGSVHDQSEVRTERVDDDAVARVSALIALSSPELAVEPDLTKRAAGLDDDPFSARQRLGAGRRAAAFRVRDEQGDLCDLPDRRCGDGYVAPGRRNPEDRGEDGEGEEQGEKRRVKTSVVRIAVVPGELIEDEGSRGTRDPG
jgi:hypothetical protein